MHHSIVSARFLRCFFLDCKLLKERDVTARFQASDAFAIEMTQPSDDDVCGSPLFVLTRFAAPINAHFLENALAKLT